MADAGNGGGVNAMFLLGTHPYSFEAADFADDIAGRTAQTLTVAAEAPSSTRRTPERLFAAIRAGVRRRMTGPA